jgi:hypothetical protein
LYVPGPRGPSGGPPGPVGPPGPTGPQGPPGVGTETDRLISDPSEFVLNPDGSFIFPNNQIDAGSNSLTVKTQSAFGLTMDWNDGAGNLTELNVNSGGVNFNLTGQRWYFNPDGSTVLPGNVYVSNAVTTTNLFASGNVVIGPVPTTILANLHVERSDVFIGNSAVTGSVSNPAAASVSRLIFDNSQRNTTVPNKIVLYSNASSGNVCGLSVITSAQTDIPYLVYQGGAHYFVTKSTSSLSGYQAMIISADGQLNLSGSSSRAHLDISNGNLPSSNVQVRIDSSNVALVTSGSGLVGFGTLTPSANLHVVGNIYASNAVTTTNLFANTLTTSSITVTGNIYASNAIVTTNLFAATETLTGTAGQTTLTVTGNVYASNAVTTKNLTCDGFTSNITNTIFNFDTLTVPYMYSTTLNVSTTSNLSTVVITGSLGQSSLTVTGNIYASNAVTTANLFANTLTMSNATSSITVTGNIYASNAIVTTNLFAATETLTGTAGQTTLTVTGNVYASNAVTTKNLTCDGFTSNITNTIFNFDTLTVPYMYSTTLNVSTTSNLSTVVITGSLGQSSLTVTGNIYASNAVTTANLFANTLTMSNATSSITVTGNIYASNAVVTTNIVCAGFTSNASNTIFNFSTLTIPFVYCTTLNTYSTANVLTLSVPGSTGQTSLAISSATGQTGINVAGNVYASNAVTTTTLYGNVSASNVVVTPATGVTGISVTGNVYVSNAVSTTNLFVSNVTYSLDVLAQGPYFNPSTTNASVITQWYSRLVNTTTQPFWSVSANPQFSYINTSNLVGYISQTLLNDGRVLFNQINGNNIGFFYPDTNQFSYVTGVSINGFDYSGVLQIPDGRVVFIPCNGNKVGLLNPINYSFSTVSTGTALNNMHYGAVYEPTGNVIMTPTNSSNVGIFNTNTGTYSRVAFSSEVAINTILYFGSVLLPDGRVVFIPNGTSNVGVYTPSTATYSNVTVTVSGKYAGGCLLPDGNVFMVPNSASSNACIYNPNLNTVSNVTTNGPGIGGGGNCAGAVALPDGRIVIMHALNNYGGGFIIYNYKTGSYTLIPGLPGGIMYQNIALLGGGTLVPDGRIFFTTSYGAGLFETRTPAPREFCLHPFFNKF